MEYLKLKSDEFAKVFVDNLLLTNRGYNYYVNWENISLDNKFKEEWELLNTLIKNKDFDNEFKKILKEVPMVVALFPYLFALAKREREDVWKGKIELSIINSYINEEDNLGFKFEIDHLKNGLNDNEIEEYLKFFKNMGLKNLFLNILVKDVRDYIIGILVGLDSNGRKNRGGEAFELACEPLIQEVCEKFNIILLTQTKFKELKKYGFDISDDIKDRKADFILLKDNVAMNIEVNFFNGGGSKPEEIIDSYINRQEDLKKNSILFALLTDGKGCWGNEDKHQLLKAFRNLNYLMNFNLAKNGMLQEILEIHFK